ncbi:MAG: efflux RND transporter periplasmic adaptor subunit [Myxococcaceae bacterium]
MTASAKGRLQFLVFLAVLGSCGVQIIRNANATPVTEPIGKDLKKAEREAKSRVGGDDVKEALPSFGATVIGGNGVVEPSDRETKVAAQVTAVVRAVAVAEGQQVKKGSLLVQLDDTVEQAALQSAEADLQGERATLGRVLKGVRVEDKDAVAADAQAARARAELSAGVLARTEQLAKTGAATPDELERAKRQAQTDDATARASDARLRAAEAGSRIEEVALQRARVAAAEARVAQARAQVERLSVRAPLDGEVLQVRIRPGELYSFQGAEPLVVMGDTSKLRVRMDVDERDVARLKIGEKAWVMADAFGDQKFAGRVVELGRRFGRKNVRTDDPIEKNDTKVLETVLELEGTPPLVVGQRVTSFITPE